MRGRQSTIQIPGWVRSLWRQWLRTEHPRQPPACWRGQDSLAVLVVCALVALEASSWLHLIQDGDPMPRLPRPLRRRRR